MIYRKWSLLTGPAAILGGIVGVVVVSTYIFARNDPILTTEQKKQDSSSSTK